MKDLRVDVDIANAAPFARPILKGRIAKTIAQCAEGRSLYWKYAVKAPR